MEWCPESRLIACGNYQLEEVNADVEKPSRQGCIYLMEVMPDDSIEIHVCIETRGILDQKWFDGETLGVVTSTGQLVVYSLDRELKKLEEKSRVSLDGTETIALSLDYWKEKTLVSDSMGNISLFDPELKNLGIFSGHGFEAWTCAFDRDDPNVFYSGEFI